MEKRIKKKSFLISFLFYFYLYYLQGICKYTKVYTSYLYQLSLSFMETSYDIAFEMTKRKNKCYALNSLIFAHLIIT